MNKKINWKQLWDIFVVFMKIGCFTFGGGYAMIPLIEKEVITHKQWVEKEEIIDILAVSQSVPGAIAINSSTFIGYKIAGKKGAAFATLGVVLPSFVIITVLAAFFAKFQDYPIVKAAFTGIRPAVVALILLAAVKIGKTALQDKLTIFLSLLTFFLVILLDIHAIYIIAAGAAVGATIHFLFPKAAEKILTRGRKDQ